jgi:hypothetical protein
VEKDNGHGQRGAKAYEANQLQGCFRMPKDDRANHDDRSPDSETDIRVANSLHHSPTDNSFRPTIANDDIDKGEQCSCATTDVSAEKPPTLDLSHWSTGEKASYADRDTSKDDARTHSSRHCL